MCPMNISLPPPPRPIFLALCFPFLVSLSCFASLIIPSTHLPRHIPSAGPHGWFQCAKLCARFQDREVLSFKEGKHKEAASW